MSISQEKREIMQKRYQEYEKQIIIIHSAIKDIIHGQSELSVCAKYGLDLSKFRRYLTMNLIAETNHPNDFAFNNTPEGYNWRKRLLEDITGTSNVFIIDNFDEQFETVKAMLTSMERKVITRTYICDLSLNEIGTELNISRERVRQIKANALRKLRQKEYLYPLLYDKVYIQEYKDKTTKLSEIQKDIKLVNTAILQSQAKLSKHKNILQSLEKILIDLPLDDTMLNSDSNNCLTSVLEHSYISDLNLSARANNALKRAKIKTAADLMDYTYEDLMKIRNLGVSTVNEIIEKMHELGMTNFPKE